MALTVRCACGKAYELKDEYVGRLVRCPQCQAVSRADRSPYGPASQADPAFDRDVFLLRQKHLAINEQYTVSEESGAPIIHVERAVHLLRNVLARIAGAVAALLVLELSAVAARALFGTGPAAGAVVLIGGLIALLTFAVVGAAASKKRQVTFYRDGQKRERLLEILQDRKLQIVVATYTVQDARGEAIARLRKNCLYNLFRKRWEIRTLAGQLAVVAKEDSIVVSLLRRVLGSMYGLLRTTFVLCGPDGRSVLGEFRRKTTILDRYALDLTRDRHRKLDRRLAVALGVMLDTGERR